MEYRLTETQVKATAIKLARQAGLSTAVDFHKYSFDEMYLIFLHRAFDLGIKDYFDRSDIASFAAHYLIDKYTQ